MVLENCILLYLEMVEFSECCCKGHTTQITWFWGVFLWKQNIFWRSRAQIAKRLGQKIELVFYHFAKAFPISPYLYCKSFALNNNIIEEMRDNKWMTDGFKLFLTAWCWLSIIIVLIFSTVPINPFRYQEIFLGY